MISGRGLAGYFTSMRWRASVTPVRILKSTKKTA
jgi:hypothetical protein